MLQKKKKKKTLRSIIFDQKLTSNLKPRSGKKGFCFRSCGDLFDPRTTFSQHRRAWPTSCVFHCWVSHTKPDIHTPTVTAQCDPVILQGWEEFLFASVPQLSRRVWPLGLEMSGLFMPCTQNFLVHVRGGRGGFGGVLARVDQLSSERLVNLFYTVTVHWWSESLNLLVWPKHLINQIYFKSGLKASMTDQMEH